MRRLSLLLILNLLMASGTARAELSQFGAYDVHYSLFASDFLRPEVASALGIVRAPDRAILNISVRKRQGNVPDTGVVAVVSGTFSDLIRPVDLEFRTVREEGAAYALAEFPFRNNETLYFDIRILPEGESTPLALRFNKTLYID